MLGKKLRVCHCFIMIIQLHLRPPVNGGVNKETIFVKGRMSEVTFQILVSRKHFVVFSTASSKRCSCTFPTQPPLFLIL